MLWGERCDICVSTFPGCLLLYLDIYISLALVHWTDDPPPPPRFFNICPETQPTLIGISEVLTYIAALHQSWAACSPYMSAYDCTAELNFTNVAGGPFYTPDDVPASGTATLSVIAGTVSAPPSGTLFSYTNFFDSTIYTITAAGDGNSAGFGGVTGVTSGGPTDTRTAPTATITLKSGAVGGGRHKRSWVLLTSICVLVGVLTWL